ncbi:unnamed protein product, partial [Brassica rapa]
GQPHTLCVCWRTPTDVVDVLCVLTDTHRRLACADGHTRTATDVLYVLCVLNRQPTLAKITRTVHGKGHHAESKDPHADMCTDGQPRTHEHPVCAGGHTRKATDVMCVLMDTHVHPACADGHPRTSYTHGHTHTATDVLCVLTDTHGPHERPVCTEQTAHVGQNHPKSPREGSAPRNSVLSPRTSVLICVLMDSHECPMCADEHTRTATDVLCLLTDNHGLPVCACGHPQTSCLTDTHGHPVCADGHPRTSCPRTSCVCWRTPTDVLCVLNRQPTWAKITRTVHRKGQRAESKDQRADMCTDGHPRTFCVC